MILTLRPGTFAIARLDLSSPSPPWLRDGPAEFLSETRTADERSIVGPDRSVVTVR
ncbi:hypothetical protein [Tautonia sociabilis]|uniref:hypothetical protein n=1 Tax=Tautonia sociabilis TaxID=2080755 RepID=UPI00370406E8